MFTKLQKGIISTVTVGLIGFGLVSLGQVAVITDEAQRDRSPASHCMKAIVESSENPETTVADDVMNLLVRSDDSRVILVRAYSDSQTSSEENFFKCSITKYKDITGLVPVTPDLAQRMIDKQSATG